MPNARATETLATKARPSAPESGSEHGRRLRRSSASVAHAWCSGRDSLWEWEWWYLLGLELEGCWKQREGRPNARATETLAT